MTANALPIVNVLILRDVGSQDAFHKDSAFARARFTLDVRD